MIMHTKIRVKETGRIIQHVTQQYEVGTYIIIDNNPRLQGAVTTKETQYHIALRKKVLKSDAVELSGGTLIDYSGKEPINEFIEL